MQDDLLLSRITTRADVFDGRPIVRDLRISVATVLSLMAQGESVDGILADYPELEEADVRACLAYAHAAIQNDRLGFLRAA